MDTKPAATRQICAQTTPDTSDEAWADLAETLLLDRDFGHNSQRRQAVREAKRLGIVLPPRP